MNVLRWLKGEGAWAVFVANRVEAIRKIKVF